MSARTDAPRMGTVAFASSLANDYSHCLGQVLTLGLQPVADDPSAHLAISGPFIAVDRLFEKIGHGYASHFLAVSIAGSEACNNF